MTNLFKKAACFTDIHFGNKSNSKQFNQDADRFVDWFIGQAKENNCETCIFLGDWHHQRAAINVDTLSYSLDNLENYQRILTQPTSCWATMICTTRRQGK